MTDPAAPTTKEAVAQWMIDHGYATGHGDTLDDLLDELVREARSTPAETLDVERWIEAYRESVDRSQPEDGDCECGLPMESHAGGWALLHHDEQMIRNTAEVYARLSPHNGEADHD